MNRPWSSPNRDGLVVGTMEKYRDRDTTHRERDGTHVIHASGCLNRKYAAFARFLVLIIESGN